MSMMGYTQTFVITISFSELEIGEGVEFRFTSVNHGEP